MSGGYIITQNDGLIIHEGRKEVHRGGTIRSHPTVRFFTVKAICGHWEYGVNVRFMRDEERTRESLARRGYRICDECFNRSQERPV